MDQTLRRSTLIMSLAKTQLAKRNLAKNLAKTNLANSLRFSQIELPCGVARYPRPAQALRRGQGAAISRPAMPVLPGKPPFPTVASFSPSLPLPIS
jgi:hypothetical protein